MTAEPARRRTDAQPLDPEVEALKRELAALKAEVGRLEQLADRDVLTPLYNRRAFVRELSRAIAFCRRYEAQAAVLYLDLDGFKAVNDAQGHAAGDAALVKVAGILTGNIRESDVAARLGGDEFAVLLFQAGEDEARAKAQRLAALIAAAGEGLGATFGVRAFDGHDDAETWLAEADAAMFVRKKGR